MGRARQTYAKIKMMRDILGKHIREKRKSLGMTQLELAKKINISRQTLNYYEQGTTNMRFDIFWRLIDNKLFTLEEVDKLLKGSHV